MSNVEFTSHRGEVMDAMKHAVRNALQEIGIEAENHAKTIAEEKGVKATGALINSITWAVGEEDGQPAVYIGTNKHYAIFQELGTSIYNPKSPTSKPFWYYKDEFGKWHKAYPQKPRPFLKPAVEDFRDKYKEIVEDNLKNG